LTDALEAQAPGGRVLFEDDFSIPNGRWRRVQEASGLSDYIDGVYRLQLVEPDYVRWSTPGLRFRDIWLEVTAMPSRSPQPDRFGLICRYQDAENYYAFLISSDGYYGIARVKDGVHQILGAESMQPSDLILQGMQPNVLRADCIGSTLSLYVNYQPLVSVQAEDFAAGDVGLILGSYAEPGVEVLFDNFRVVKP
jgi:hypothetical protein